MFKRPKDIGKSNTSAMDDCEAFQPTEFIPMGYLEYAALCYSMFIILAAVIRLLYESRVKRNHQFGAKNLRPFSLISESPYNSWHCLSICAATWHIAMVIRNDLPYGLSQSFEDGLGTFKAFLQTICSMTYCILYYPIFLAIGSQSKLLTMLGTIQCWLLTFAFAIAHIPCQKEPTSSQLLSMLTVLVPAFAFAALSLYLPAKFLSQCFPKWVQEEEFSLEYVRERMKKSDEPHHIKENGICGQNLLKTMSRIVLIRNILSKLRGVKENRDKTIADKYFKSSLTVLLGTTLSVAMLYTMVISLLNTVISLHIAAIYLFDGLAEIPSLQLGNWQSNLTGNQNFSGKLDQIMAGFEILPTLFPSIFAGGEAGLAFYYLSEMQFWLCFVLGIIYFSITSVFLIGLSAIARTKQAHQRDVIDVQSGQKALPDLFPAISFSPILVLLRSSRYVAFQCVKVICGFFSMLLLTLLLVCNLVLPFAVIFRYKLWGVLLSIVIGVVLYSLFVSIYRAIQIILIPKLFLTKIDKTSYGLAFKNLTLLSIYHYLSIFMNIPVAIFVVINSIVMGVISSAMQLMRMDLSAFSVTNAHLDATLHTYAGLVAQDATCQNHIMRAAASIMLRNVKERETDAKLMASISSLSTGDSQVEFVTRNSSEISIFGLRHQNLIVKNKWFLAITLINNPNLRKERRPIPTAKN